MHLGLLSNHLALYLCVVEHGSFSAAARLHQLTPSAVARRMDTLEQSLGVSLLLRSTHQVRTTPAGLAFAERSRRILAELQQARAEAVSLSHAPEGLIRIDAPTPFGRHRLAPVIADFLSLNPGLDVQLRLIDSFVDLNGEHLGEVDVVIRIGNISSSRLIATPLASMMRIACASPSYLKQHGTPQHPHELIEHDGLDWDGLAPPYAWRFYVDGHWQQHRPGRLRLTSNNAEALLHGVHNGLGIAHLPSWQASEPLIRGDLIPLFCANGLPEPEPSLIYALRMERDASPRVRLLLAYLRERFGQPPPWDVALSHRFSPAS